jgi:hypothetical protein
MHVFLSWSGRVSQEVALALRQWLPFMHHAIKPFMSSVDIRRGENWGHGLSRELKDAQYGIVCVTPFNTFKPWMNFEAGALYRLPHLAPFLFRVDRQKFEHEHGPLTQFQLTQYSGCDDRSKHEFLDLLESINGELPETERLDNDVLHLNFDHWWTKLSDDLNAIPAVSAGETSTAYPWLRTFDDLAVHDLRPDCETVWFITSDVYKYTLRTGLREKIEGNLSKVRYRVLIPDPDGCEEREAREQIDRLARKYPERLEYRSFEPQKFSEQATSDYVVLELTRGAVAVFVRIPVDADTDYWIDTEERAAHGFHQRFVQLWNSQTELPSAAPEPMASIAHDGALGL